MIKGYNSYPKSIFMTFPKIHIIKMKILHVIEGIQESCGVSRFVVEVVRDMQQLGENVAIITTRNWNVPANDITIYENFNPETICEKFKPQLLHIHGCWNMYIHRMAHWSQANRIPYVFSPHGAWTSWAWQYHGWKKKIAWFLFQKKDALKAAAFHATIEAEVDDIKQLKLNHEIIVSPLGVRAPKDTDKLSDIFKREKIVLYLGRLHKKKNVHGLLDAWESIPRKIKENWNLVIAGKSGPDDENYLESLLKKNTAQCCFVGEVTGKTKEELYQSARIFVLPSFSENFGSVVLEALSNGVPVITTSGTPWENTERYGCGWRTTPDYVGLSQTIIRAIQSPNEELSKMSMAARKFVQDNYTWEHSAKLLLDGYKKILEK